MKNLWIKRLVMAGVLLAGLFGGAAWWAVEQTRQVPDFYVRATARQTDRTAQASRQMVAEVEQLQNRVARIGTWQASFSDEEINGWLIEQLPEKFPRLLAYGASEPRIMIEDDRLLAAVRYKNKHIDTVVSCELHVELTEQPNMLALRVENLRAGALPLPLGNFKKGISREAAKGDVEIRWDQTETEPIALVTVPHEDPRYVLGPVVVESIVLVEGKLLLSGHTGKLALETYQPKGPVYQFVSFKPHSHRIDQSPQLSSDIKRAGKAMR